MNIKKVVKLPPFSYFKIFIYTSKNLQIIFGNNKNLCYFCKANFAPYGDRII